VTLRARAVVFAAVTAACVAVAVVATARSVDDRRAADAAAPSTADKAADLLARAGATDGAVLVFRDLDRRDYGRLAVVRVGSGGAVRHATGLACDRVHYAAGAGLCVQRGGGLLNESTVKLLDARLRVRGEVKVPGTPSRARVSPDGRLGAVTTFVTGHSYATPGAFSTATTLIDLRAGKKIADLEDLAAFDGPRRVTARDVNYWGVTFARDGTTFYATMATGGETHLMRGDRRSRRMRVIHDNVECPSLSPDGTRIGYKKLVSSGAGSPKLWRFTVLDLETMRETRLAEPTPRDDQLEWLDDGHVLYGNGEETWTVPADGSGAPARYLSAASSPAVAR
jgi:hypothetical protein